MGWHQTVVLCQRQQDKAEFAGLRDVQAGAQRHAVGCAQDLGQNGHQCKLEQHGKNQQHQDQRPVGNHFMPIEHHADADKKQAEQYVMKRPDIGFNLMLVFGFRDQHARNEGAQRQTETSQFGEPCQTQGDQQQVQDKQFFAFAPGNECQPPTHDALTADQQ